MKSGGGPGAGGVEGYWYWAEASSAQLLWAISSLRKGYSGDSRFMPFKAFGVASATIASLQASGIHSVDNMKRCKYKDWAWITTKSTR